MHHQKLIENIVRTLGCDNLQRNIVVDSEMMIDKLIDKIVDPEVNCTHNKDRFETNFMVFIDLKIIPCEVELLHAYGVDTLDT